LEEGLKRKLRT